MQQKPMPGSAKEKRKCWSRKRIFGAEVHYSTKKHKKYTQRKLRNGKCSDFSLNGSGYKKVMNQNARWEYVS